jgi:hypothetical protein
LARYRTIKPEFFADEKLAECTRDARLLFVGLWCFVSDMGRAQNSPRRLKNEIFPGDDDVDSASVVKWLEELRAVGCIEIYECEDESYIHIPNFLRHQKIDKPSHCAIPKSPEEFGLQCRCLRCKERDIDLKTRPKNGKVFHVKRGEPSASPSRVDESTSPLSVESTRNVVECSVVEVENQNPVFSQNETGNGKLVTGHASSLTSKDPRTARRALDNLAGAFLDILSIPSNDTMIQAVGEAIRLTSKGSEQTLEAAAEQLLRRCALVKRDDPPANWLFWFRNGRYDQSARPSQPVRLTFCGLTGCSDGWRPGNGGVVRCPDCVALWQKAPA